MWDPYLGTFVLEFEKAIVLQYMKSAFLPCSNCKI